MASKLQKLICRLDILFPVLENKQPVQCWGNFYEFTNIKVHIYTLTIALSWDDRDFLLLKTEESPCNQQCRSV